MVYDNRKLNSDLDSASQKPINVAQILKIVYMNFNFAGLCYVSTFQVYLNNENKNLKICKGLPVVW